MTVKLYQADRARKRWSRAANVSEISPRREADTTRKRSRATDYIETSLRRYTNSLVKSYR